MTLRAAVHSGPRRPARFRSGFGGAIAAAAALGVLLSSGIAPPARAADGSSDAAIAAAVASSTRSPAFVARDPSRHPAQELAFFGIRPDQTVVEIWPFGGYWTEILAPMLRDHGTYYAALSGSSHDAELKPLLAAKPSLYDKVKITRATGGDIAPAGSVDAVLTFRNLHNWIKQGNAPQMLASFFRALKPGGILGMEDHRAHANTRPNSGYVAQDEAIRLARAAGFELVGSSEMDANPRDTADWPAGVWTLPPTYALGDKDRAKYQLIGEADNFVLKFRKP
ncbi:class I SAM-dependent methyltransferase [Rhizosaccharibacter radicis]|uniref:Methyltransferase n=1 Tax=Rhizosaccharibacter radicis TaxID=2782605 RepID=A0ABT1VSQ4_9PROT|nr:methyltransferase [Acetobacteraceae bacterium KSS12]